MWWDEVGYELTPFASARFRHVRNFRCTRTDFPTPLGETMFVYIEWGVMYSLLIQDEYEHLASKLFALFQFIENYS